MTTVLPPMNSLSDVVALKRHDMESIERRRQLFYPLTPRVVPWIENPERPNSYFPIINRSYTLDKTHIPGTAQRKRFNQNIVNREASWSPYTSEKIKIFDDTSDGAKAEYVEKDEFNEKMPSFNEPIRHPCFRISESLGLLRRDYKHPLSMYEDAINMATSRYKPTKSHQPFSRDPIMPRQYYNVSPFNYYLFKEKVHPPFPAGKEWVANRWKMWNGGTSSSVQL